jgi:uncharacterized protein YhhL (DUF1145 family)
MALLKATCIAVYLAALVGLFVRLPYGLASAALYATGVLLAAHALEVLVAFRSIRRYRGPLAASIGLTLLFGFLHWIPLAREEER